MVSKEDIEGLKKKIEDIASRGGYYLNPDEDFVNGLLHGLLVNEKRYGYPACPCRLASGIRGEDLDIICPCDYRDQDIAEYGTCYCSLYVSKDVMEGRLKPSPIPERRNPSEKKAKGTETGEILLGRVPLPVWRCRVCGYLCEREEPPPLCPICKADKDRFERFI
ncbi:MAG: hypothetical protein N2745_06335 [Syntrophorhabdaceae bacterium]|nr:hypothetical protein [Syntrophorhabdaceae bacterium]